MPWLVLRILGACVSRQLLIHNHKMELTKLEIRVLLKHYRKQDYKADRRISDVEWEGVLSERVTQRWFQNFNTGEEKTGDLLFSGRCELWDIQNIRRVLKENSKKNTSRLWEELASLKDTIHRQINILGKSCRSCRSVPHELTPQLAQRIADTRIFRQLIGNPMYGRFIRRIATCDEKWVNYLTLTPRNSCSVSVNLPKTSLKKSVRPQSNAVCLLEFWRCDSLGVWSKRACSRCASLFSTTERVHEILRRSYPSLIKRNRVLLQQENTTLHITRRSMTKFRNLGVIELLPYPA